VRVILFTQCLARDERGATIVEYSLIVALIAMGLVLGLQEISSSTRGNLTAASAEMNSSAD